MRTIVNASMSEEMANKIKKIAKERNFKSTSEYLVYAVNLEQSFISEDELLNRSKEAQESYDKGEVMNFDDLKKM